MKRVVSLFVAVALAAGLLALPLGSAEAAFPGTNGKIIFDSDRLTAVGGPGLYTITPGGTAAKIPGTSSGDNQPAWSPDGSRIAFQSASTTNQEISVMNVDGSGRRQLTTTPVAEQEPTWSPDGSKLAFVAGTSGTDATTDLEIWVMNADGSGLTQLTNTLQAVRDTQPAWSPLGNQIAFVSEGRTGDANSNIYVMDTDPATDDAINLTPNDTTTNPVYQWNDEDPSWSPDGTQITYSTVQDVWKMNANGTGKTNLTINSGGGQNPAWSPDDNSIVYVRSGDIYVMDADGGNKAAVDTTPRQDVKPDWQPNPPTCDITGTNGDNTTLSGTTADETICGLGGNDIITGGGGNDILMGGGGTDTLVAASGRATLNGGDGIDTASFAGSATPIEASLVSGFARRVTTDPLEGAALVGIERLTGSSLADSLTGSGGANKLVGGDGADEILGLGGKDKLHSRDGAKNDTVNGGPGTDACTTDNREISIKSCE